MWSALEALVIAAHLWVVADVPPAYGVAVVAASQAYDVDPYDAAALLVSEHSGPTWDFSLSAALERKRWPDYETDGEGSAGERGLYQIMPSWARRVRRPDGEIAGLKRADLWHPLPNIVAGVWVLRRAQWSHVECLAYGDRDHTWVAHWKCTRSAYADRRGPCWYAQRKWRAVRRTLVAY